MHIETASATHDTPRQYIAIWIDHQEARIFHIDPNALERAGVPPTPQRVHHKLTNGGGTREHPEDARRFFAEVSRSLSGPAQILIVGPSSAKHEFLKYLQMHAHSVELRIAGVETLDHPSDAQLVALAKKHFVAK